MVVGVGTLDLSLLETMCCVLHPFSMALSLAVLELCVRCFVAQDTCFKFTVPALTPRFGISPYSTLSVHCSRPVTYLS
jgi:hypothetical protein